MILRQDSSFYSVGLPRLWLMKLGTDSFWLLWSRRINELDRVEYGVHILMKVVTMDARFVYYSTTQKHRNFDYFFLPLNEIESWCRWWAWDQQNQHVDKTNNMRCKKQEEWTIFLNLTSIITYSSRPVLPTSPLTQQSSRHQPWWGLLSLAVMNLANFPCWS